jgi:transposase
MRGGSRPAPVIRRGSTGHTEQPIRTGSGLELPLYCFDMVLGHSRDSFCRLTGSQDLVTFWACHRAAFTHFGGVPHELLYEYVPGHIFGLLFPSALCGGG